MDRWQDRVAVVTGASSGIGAAVAKDLVRAGCQVVGLARRVERMEALRDELPDELQSRLHAIKCDVADIDSVTAAFDWIELKLGGVDILVNNAGVLIQGQILTLELEKLEQVLQVNLMGAVYCARRSVQSMRDRDVAGHVVIVNSVTGHSVPNPPDDSVQCLNMYTASKHAVTALAEVLRQELRGFKTQIKVTNVSPGVTDTELVPAGWEALPKLQSEDIASGIMYALATPPHVQVHQLTIKPLGEMI